MQPTQVELMILILSHHILVCVIPLMAQQFVKLKTFYLFGEQRVMPGYI